MMSRLIGDFLISRSPSRQMKFATNFVSIWKNIARKHPEWFLNPITRNRFRKRLDQFSSRMAPSSLSKNLEISPLASGFLVRPSNVSRDEQDKGPLIFYLHGGGYVMGSFATHFPLVSFLVKSSKRPVYFLEYSLCPQNPFPTQIGEVTRAYRTLLESVPNDIVIAGESAGGHLTISSVLNFHLQGLPLPIGVVGLSPWLDWSANRLGRVHDGILRDCFVSQEAENFLFVDKLLDPFFKNSLHLSEKRIPDVHNDLTDPSKGYGAISIPTFLNNLAIDHQQTINKRQLQFAQTLHDNYPTTSTTPSPLLSLSHAHPEVLTEFPPTLLQASESETLLSDTLLFHDSLKLVGKKVNLEVYPGLLHGWQVLPLFFEDARFALQRVIQFAQECQNERN